MGENLPAITPQQAIESIKKAFPKEADVLLAVLNKDIIQLATDEAFALRDSNGEIMEALC